MDLKKTLTFDEQLDKLASHGMIIRDREKAKDILKINIFQEPRSKKQKII